MPVPETEIASGLRRRWLYILPAVFVTYSLAYLDRANYGFGAAAGMAATLHISGRQSSLLSGLFFLGYFTFQIPGATLARRFSIHRVVFLALLVWGSLAALTGILHSFVLLALDRFLLGIAESLIFPVMLLLLTRWFTRAERSRANSILLLGNPVTVLWMSALTGLLIDRFGWQRTFIFEGLPSIAWGFLWIFLVKDRPSEANWLPPVAAQALEAQLAADQRRIAPAGSVAQALVRPDVLLLSAMYFLWSVGV
jgi:sugar phosphate permease